VSPDRTEWVSDGRFTKRFLDAYRGLVEARRLEAVRLELDQGKPTLVATDATALKGAERQMVLSILSAARKIDALFRRQSGGAPFEDRLESMDDASRALFLRNNGPWCVASRTERDPFCSAMPDYPGRQWDSYPMEIPQDSSLCQTMADHPDSRELLAPFTVVRRVGDVFKALPLTDVYEEAMASIAVDLEGAAPHADKAGEKAMGRYLRAAAKGFRTNDWAEADETWAAMNPSNSRWYLRIGPDEVYWDLCQQKAGFHVSFARIDPGSMALQKRLDALRVEMEQSLGRLAPAYAPRNVRFRMPDFIEIVVNAGNSRHPIGATIGQSLPNWGKVAEEGRGRTVVMTNLYTDPDSQTVARAKAQRLLGPGTMARYSEDRRIALLDIILHEATHNLGPHSDYKVDGKRPGEVFGGRTASTLEELKAQTGAWFYTDLLRRSGVVTDDEAKALYVHALAWSFGHLSQGLWSPNGSPKPYSQLSAVQVGWLVENGALSWEVEEDADNGRPTGRFELQFDLIHGAMEALMTEVVRIKAEGDVNGAKALLESYVSGDKADMVHLDEIIERLAEFPRGSLVYEVRL
jgi:hypothetical protein